MIKDLQKNSSNYVNFRNSHLTKLLKSGLTNSKAFFIACINSTIAADNQTAGTLEVAKDCSKIKSKVVANIECGKKEALDAELLRLQEEHEQLLREKEAENRRIAAVMKKKNDKLLAKE